MINRANRKATMQIQNLNKETLQAHGKKQQTMLLLLKECFAYLKRVSLRLSVKLKASVSIEASIAIPIFMFCFLELLSLLNYLGVYNSVLYAVKAVGEPVSVWGYAYDELMDSDEEIQLGKDVVSSLVFSQLYLTSQIRQQCETPLFEKTIEGGVEGISLLGSYINTRESTISILARYTVKPIISIAGTSLKMSSSYYGRMWTGYSLEDEEGGEYVFITANGSVYHLTKSCTHLTLSIKSVNSSELSELRNASGGRYTACVKCGASKESVTIYYIAATGERYHTEVSCSGLKRTIYSVLKEEVSDLPACSRCGQAEGDDGA